MGIIKRTKGNSGFTLVEVLATAAILLILLSLSAVGIVHYRDYLKMTELDNAAREIYMAAENRAILLSGGQQLVGLVQTGTNLVALPAASAAAEEENPPAEATAVAAYYVTKAQAAQLHLLREESIDPALWNGDFYIVYEPVSGCVTDVFYTEQPMGLLGSPNFQTFYDQWAGAQRSSRVKTTPMLGHYSGGLAQGKDIGALETATVLVTIHNEERLTVSVSCQLPGALSLSDAELEVTLEYQGTTLQLTSPTYADRKTTHADGYTWVLDALDGPQFRALDAGLTPGGDFTVTATLSSPGGRFAPATGSASDNSLFAAGSDGEQAEIRCLRHLQNLSSGFSGTAAKTSAVQTGEILCRGNETYPDYAFRPIVNNSLASYDGGGYQIHGLYVTPASADGQPAGLFSTATGTSFRNLRLVNATVGSQDAVKTLTAGALVGVATDAEFIGCQVYWEPTDTDDLRSLLGSDEEGDWYRYQITGASAGGLVGELDGGSLTNCLAATLVSGDTVAGGLIGVAHGQVVLSGSYGDCYLSGGNVAGLIGNLDGSATLVDCYAAGFADMEKATTAAGLCLGSGTTATKNVYSVLRYPGRTDIQTVFELTEQQKTGADAFSNTFYLGAGRVGATVGKEGQGRSYTEMTAAGFASQMGSAFGWKTARESNPYNLREHLNLVVYSFPGLAALPHYGDWGAQFKEPSLVYYEQYSDGTHGFSGGNARYLIRELSDDKGVTSDGYAVAFLAENLGKATKVALTYTYFDPQGNRKELQQSCASSDLIKTSGKNDEGNEAEYYLVPLPEEFVNAGRASGDFYQYLKFALEIDTSLASGEYFYNPHFAETVIPYVPEEDTPTDWSAGSAADYAANLAEKLAAVSIRTPRHLYNLSRFAAYYHNEEHSYTFRQGLHLNYATYMGYSLFDEFPFPQSPIGSYGLPFLGVYDGGCRTIEGVSFYVPAESTRFYAGLFGFSEGTLRNIVYRMDASDELTVAMGDGSRSLYVGGLVGGNTGMVQNCAVSGVHLTGYSFGSTLYVGGLAGQNNGIIQGCAAESASLSADSSSYAHAYVGGLVGENARSRSIIASYAVGRVTAVVDTTSDARICGFVGYNSGNILNSYAAVDLKSSGLQVETYGFCGVRDGSQSGTYYLNEGNFTYRESSYTANYTPRKAAAIKYDALAAGSSPVAGMGKVAGTGSYPYPTAVTDAAGRPVHYGQWPEPMNLGEMGVYYWEKLELGGKDSYHVSLLSVDTTDRAISKQTTLSVAHDDGGVVTDYGYGYYQEKGKLVSLDVQDINYTTVDSQRPGAFNPSSTSSDQAVDEALALLMPGFDFHSYHSFVPAANGGVAGIYPAGKPNGTFTLTQGPVKVSFAVNPHFADALSVQGINSAGWNTAKAPTAAPGSQAANPYGVRSVAQLEFINWNSTNRNTTTVLETNKNYTQFPYLSYSNSTGQYFWVQSHDLKGEDGRFYTPIAEYYDPTSDNQGNLYGWFGGSYNGDDYVIENLNIQGQTASCAGLFGVVYNGALRNIVLYSSDGKGVIASGHDENTQSRWYAIGGLAGVAASSSGSAVQNCAVAGYTINANIRTCTKSGWGGSGIGGLVGISDMALANCSAVTNIQVPATARDNDNMRIGGLVGTCQESITNCYAGGKISISSSAYSIGIYVGGLVGGSYLKPLAVGGNANTLIGVVGYGDGTGGNNDKNETNNALANCYSYVALPKSSDNSGIKALYALGGTGELNPAGNSDGKANHGRCTMTNCFYLDSIRPTITGAQVKTDIGGNGNGAYTRLELTALSHQQLAGQANLPDGGRIYGKLTAFSPVTSEIGGFSAAGKYSYPPSSRGELVGMDYPFPTILTREGGAFHVHYGEWPNHGIERASGGAPIGLDLFADPTWEETLALSAGIPAGGSWSAKAEDETVATATAAAGRLSVTAAGVGTTKLHIYYRVGDVDYGLTLTVNVTAELRLSPETVTLFTNDTATVPLQLFDRNGQELALTGLRVTGVNCDSALVRASLAAGDPPSLTLASGEEATGDAGVMVNVSYTYQYGSATYPASGSVDVRIVQPPGPSPVEEDGNGLLRCTVTFDPSVTILEAALSESTLPGLEPVPKPPVLLTAEKNRLILSDVPAEIPQVAVELTLQREGQTHQLYLIVPIQP